MEEVNLTLIEPCPAALAIFRSLLVQFEQFHQIHVNLTWLPKQGARRKLLEMASNQEAADVSQVESAWLSELANLHAFQRFTPAHLAFLEGHDQFLRASWQACQVPNQRDGVNTWAVPWLAETWAIYYRRDLLEQAGIEAKTAFDSLAHFDQTLARLAEQGIRLPLALPTGSAPANLCHLAMWVWASGGELLDYQGTRPALDQPPALCGMQAYYRLGSYLPKDVRHLQTAQADEIFSTGLAAVLVSGFWMVDHPQLSPQVAPHIGVAPFPASPYVGGSQLCIWRKTKKQQAALQLIKFLTGRQAAEQLQPCAGLPVRHDSLESRYYLEHDRYRVFADTLRGGRSFPTGGGASLLYHQLHDHATAMWEQVFSTSRPDLASLIQEHVSQINRYFEALEQVSKPYKDSHFIKL